jgi:formylglycine-generating enzyme required for sulfatase activity
MSESGGGMLRQIEPGRFRVEHPLAVNRKDGSILVYVPEGELEMGDGQDSTCPKHRVSLSAYWIGVYAVTNA